MPALYTSDFPLAPSPMPAIARIPIDIPQSQGARPQSAYILASALGLGAPVVLPSAASVVMDGNLGTFFTTTLGINATFTYQNLVVGQQYRLKIVQDGVGSKTGTFASPAWLFGAGSKTLSTAANAIDMVIGVWDGTNLLSVLDKAFA